jgi:hypothetical protein
MFVRVAWWTCVKMWVHGRCLENVQQDYHLEMWSLGLPWYWDISNVGKGKRYWKYFDGCNKIWVYTHILLLMWVCYMHVLLELLWRR